MSNSIHSLLLVDDVRDLAIVESYVRVLERAEIETTLITNADIEELQTFFEGKEISKKLSFFQLTSPNIWDVVKETFERKSCDKIIMINAESFYAIDYDYLIEASSCPVAMALRFIESNNIETISIDGKYKILPEANQNYREAYIDAGVYCIDRLIMEIDFESNAIIAELVEKNMVEGIPCGGRVISTAGDNWIEVEERPCLFLDRDGIIIEDTGYPHKKEEIRLLKECLPLIRWAKENNWLVIILTNQAGIAKGIFSEEDYFICSEYIEELLENSGVRVDDCFFSPYHPDGVVKKFSQKSLTRKPEPGLLLQAMNEYKIDLSRSVMVGDKKSDQLHIPNLKTFFLQGKYDLRDEKNIFSTHAEILEKIKDIS